MILRKLWKHMTMESSYLFTWRSALQNTMLLSSLLTYRVGRVFATKRSFTFFSHSSHICLGKNKERRYWLAWLQYILFRKNLLSHRLTMWSIHIWNEGFLDWIRMNDDIIFTKSIAVYFSFRSISTITSRGRLYPNFIKTESLFSGDNHLMSSFLRCCSQRLTFEW